MTSLRRSPPVELHTLLGFIIILYRSSFSTRRSLATTDSCSLFVQVLQRQISLTFASCLFICRCILISSRMQIQGESFSRNVSLECRNNELYRFYCVFRQRLSRPPSFSSSENQRKRRRKKGGGGERTALFLTMQTSFL